MFIHECNKKFLLSFACAAGLFLMLFSIESRIIRHGNLRNCSTAGGGGKIVLP